MKNINKYVEAKEQELRELIKSIQYSYSKPTHEEAVKRVQAFIRTIIKDWQPKMSYNTIFGWAEAYVIAVRKPDFLFSDFIIDMFKEAGVEVEEPSLAP